jgi:hypothetical protein
LFCILAFSLFIGSSLFYGYLEASSLDVDFSLVFHDNTSKLEASINDVQTIIGGMVQGWIREVKQDFGRDSRGERLGESYA